MSTVTLDDLLADFEILDDWEERYRYVIELGRSIPALDDAWRTSTYKVMGCASQVWIRSWVDEVEGRVVLRFAGDSDALIVKGLIAIVFIIFSGKSPKEILAEDASLIFQKLGLQEHLTPQRSNGLASMVARIKADARQALPA